VAAPTHMGMVEQGLRPPKRRGVKRGFGEEDRWMGNYSRMEAKNPRYSFLGMLSAFKSPLPGRGVSINFVRDFGLVGLTYLHIGGVHQI